MSTNKVKLAIAQEYKKCAKDSTYFTKKYCKIEHPTKGRILFGLYPFQETTLEKMHRERYIIINKGRQLGISTLSAAFILHNMIFNNGYKVLIIATKQDVAKNLVHKIRLMHDFLPSWLKQETLEDNKMMLRFKNNGSSVKAVSSSPDSARSEALSLLVIDEAAHISNSEEIWTAAQSTLATGGSCILLSTPNGVGNLFHRIWQESLNGGDFTSVFLPWTVHPERDWKWRKEQDILLGEKAAAQECDGDFLTSGHTVVDGSILVWYENNCVKDPIEKRGETGDLWVWKYPESDCTYVVCADVSRGDSSDFSAFHVLNIETLEQVAEFKSMIGTTEFGHLLMSIASEYNGALLAIENAYVGWAVLQTIIDLGYQNLYYTFRNDPFVDPDVHVNINQDYLLKDNMVPGFTTSTKTRPVMISKLETYYREKSPIVYSKRLIQELFTFVWKDHKAEARDGYNDDLVMSFAIGLWVRDTSLKMKTLGLSFSRSLLNNTTKTIYTPSNANKMHDSWSMKTRNNESESLTWLIK